MTESKSSDNEHMSLSLELGGDGQFKVTGSLPASLTKSASAGIVKATKFALAGISPKFYSRTYDVYLKNEIKSSLTENLLQSLKCSNNSEYANELLSSLIGEFSKKQEKRLSLIEESLWNIDQMLLKEPRNNPKETISEEFLEQFWSIADQVTFKEMRQIFARVLAREILTPNTISPSTLQTLLSLHPLIAKKFELLCNMSFSSGEMDIVVIAMPDKNNPSTRANSISSTNKVRAGDQLLEFGVSREDLLELRSAGLIRSMPGEEYPDLSKFIHSNEVTYAGKKVFIQNGQPQALWESHPISGSTNVISLTYIGSELRKIIDLTPHEIYTDKLVNFVMKNAGVELHFEEPG